MTALYNPTLVLLSIGVAILGSLAALGLTAVRTITIRTPGNRASCWSMAA